MSRAYRIRVSESLRAVIRAKDHVSSQLELLPLLPAEQLADLLSRELEKQGFQREGQEMVRREGNVTITVDAAGRVTVTGESSEDVDLKTKKEGLVYDDVGPTKEEAEAKLRAEARSGLKDQSEELQEQLQQAITDELEGVLRELRGELDKVVNRTTAEALKRKAAQMGEIREVSEDSETGDLTIVVEV